MLGHEQADEAPRTSRDQAPFGTTSLLVFPAPSEWTGCNSFVDRQDDQWETGGREVTVVGDRGEDGHEQQYRKDQPARRASQLGVTGSLSVHRQSIANSRMLLPIDNPVKWD